MEPKISVVCMKNNEKCIESLLNQTLKEIEILLFEPCSIKDTRIKYSNKPEGKYILVTDGYCEFKFNMFSTMIEIMESRNINMGICGVKRGEIKSASCVMKLDSDDKKFFAMKRLSSEGIFGSCNNVITKNIGKIFDKESFDKNFKYIYINSSCIIFSNDFVLEDENSKKESNNIEDFVRYFLEKGVKNNA